MTAFLVFQAAARGFAKVSGCLILFTHLIRQPENRLRGVLKSMLA
ncbi:hypothetical protein [Kingella sp. (in: b-proteobacteria)]|nr:hypothetical protein [Kingella sp. (in: b-proteobacteria)]